MAPNPSERIGRRLSELLEQPQDPFLLKIYLLEKGCSGRIIGSQRSSCCWPSVASNRLRKLGSHGGFRNSRAAGLLTCVFFKIAHSKFNFKKALRWCSSTPRNNRSDLFDLFSQLPNNRLFSPASAESSVFDTPFEYGLRECRVALNEALEDKSSNGRRFLSDCWREAEESICSYHCFLDAGEFEGAVHIDMIPSGFEEEWKQLEPEVTKIGLFLEAAIFADLQEEAVFDMLLFCIIK